MFAMLVLAGLYFVAVIFIERFFGSSINAVPKLLLLFIWIIVNFLDAHSTYILMRLTKNPRTEGNPIVRFFIVKFGLAWGLFLNKGVLGLLITVVLFYSGQVVMIAWTGIFVLVVLNNYGLYLKKRADQGSVPES